MSTPQKVNGYSDNNCEGNNLMDISHTSIESLSFKTVHDVMTPSKDINQNGYSNNHEINDNMTNDIIDNINDTKNDTINNNINENKMRKYERTIKENEKQMKLKESGHENEILELNERILQLEKRLVDTNKMIG